jgi:hypothetical protein
VWLLQKCLRPDQTATRRDSDYIPAFLILAGQMHQAQWYRVPELDPHTKISTSESGYSNDQISLEWLRHFEEFTAPKQQGHKRLLIVPHSLEILEQR